MNKVKSFDPGFFPGEVNFWYDTGTELHQHWRDIVHTPTLPELSPKLDSRLVALIPVLNQSRTNLCLNMSLGTNAAWKFAESLIAAGRNYGLTAEEAEELARDWNDK